MLLSTLDWALIETWKDAGIPLEAVLRGIDAAFDRYDARPSKTKKVNSLAYCSQEVLAAAEDMKEAAVGLATKSVSETGFETAKIAEFLHCCAKELAAAKLPSKPGISPEAVARDVSESLQRIAEEIQTKAPSRLEDLERRLSTLEEKLFAVILAAVPDEEIVAVRAQSDRELAPYRSKMTGGQIEQLQKQYLHKKLLEKYKLPRLSLFYM